MTVAKRREREREERREQILDAATRVFYARGYELATMEEVAVEAQLGKGTLYLYFRTKVDLLMGVAMRHQQRQLERFLQESEAAQNGLDEVRRLLLAYAEHMAHPPEHLKMVVGRWAQGVPLADDLTTAGAMRDNVMRIFGILRAAVERGQADGSIDPELDPAPLCMKLWAAVNGALLVQLQMGCLGSQSSLQAIAPSPSDMVDLLLSAIRRDVAQAPNSYETLPAAPSDRTSDRKVPGA